MIQDIFPKKFDNAYKNVTPCDSDKVIIFCGQGKGKTQMLLAVDGEEAEVPSYGEIKLLVQPEETQFVFSIDDTNYFIVFGDKVFGPSPYDNTALGIPEGLCFETMNIFRKREEGEFGLAVTTAFHLYTWYSRNRFCGMCGNETVHDSKERMVKCPKCGNMIFPMIAPAVIIGLIKRKGFVEPDGSVTEEDQILVSRYAFREYRGMALLAGFCEIGERSESTVEREIMEEVGLKCKNVKYFDSQPWGIDSNLLLGYYAELDGEDKITIDETELDRAEWVTRGEIEAGRNLSSLTATMIENFRVGNI